LCRTAAALLAPGGWLILEIGAGQAGAVTRIAAGAGWGTVRFVPDLAGLARVAILCEPDRRSASDGAPAPTEAQ
jgi:methylase of polypeptide subunit release factors